jgi:hypothetical protein
MNMRFRVSLVSTGILTSFFVLSAGSPSAASAHTLLATEATGSFFNSGGSGLAVSSGEPAYGWNSHIPAVPANTGIYAVSGNDPLSSGAGIFSWADTAGTPFSDNTGGGGYVVHTQGSKTTYDTLWTLTVLGKMWSATPVAAGATWPAWSYIGAPVPDFTPYWYFSMSVFDSADSPWVVNGDGECGSDANSHLYHWNTSSSSWSLKPGCLYLITEDGDDSLWGLSFVDGISSTSSNLWYAPNRNSVAWTEKRSNISVAAAVTSMIVEGDSSSGYEIYFADGTNLYEWKSSSGALTTVVSGGVEQVSRDQHSSAFYYTVNTGESEQLWLY